MGEGARGVMTRLIRFAMAAGAALVLAGAASAQVPDSARRAPPDTLAQRDTLTTDTVAAIPLDTVQAADTVPPPRFSDLAAAPPPGVARSLFHWDREAFLREGLFTLGELLEQVPGMIVLRGGAFLQPEVATAFGQTRGAIEVVLDGFVLDPLTTSTLDLGSLELAPLSEVRVERRLDVTRIHLTTAEPLHASPYTRIEAATAEPSGSLLRGNFAAPHVLFGPLALSVDRLEGEGRDRLEPASILGVWGKWAWHPDSNRAVQVELRQSRLERTRGVPWTGEQARRDLVVRARNRFFDGFSAELFVGRTTVEQPLPDSLENDSLQALQRPSWQFGARAFLRRGPGWLDAELRFRDSWALPERQADLSGGLELGGLLHLAGNLTSTAWKTGEGGLAYNARAEVGPFAGMSAFAEIAGGERGAPLWADSAGRSTIEAPLLESRSGTRAGLALGRWGIEATGAVVRIEADSAAPFGLPFDQVFGRTRATPAQGFEAFGRIPLRPRGLSFTGNFTYWDKLGGLLYLPARSWRLALELHTLPLASQNLEILARVEHQRRGAMLERNIESLDPEDPQNPPSAYTEMPSRDLVNAYLQIRIVDVRAFVGVYDWLNAEREDFPGRIARPRVFYGVKWQLFN